MESARGSNKWRPLSGTVRYAIIVRVAYEFSVPVTYVVQAYSKSYLFSAYVWVLYTAYNIVSLLPYNSYEFSVLYDGIIHSGA